MPVDYVNGKKVHRPYPEENTTIKEWRNGRFQTIEPKADAKITLQKSLSKEKPKYKKKGERYYKEGESKATTSLSQGKKTSSEHMKEIKSRNLKGMKDNYLRAVDLMTTPALAKSAGKALYGLAKSAKTKAFLSGLVPGIITKKGQRDYPAAQSAFKAGEGQEAVRRKITGSRDILGKNPKRFKGIDMDELDRGAAQAVLNPKNKEDKYLGKLAKAGKLTLAEAFEAVKNKINISKVDVHKTNRELNKTLGGTAGVRQEERIMEKAREGTFNPPHTEALKRIHSKKKREK